MELVPCTKKLGIQSELHMHRNSVNQSVELLLLVPMHIPLAIPKCHYYTSLYNFADTKDYSYIRINFELTNTPLLNLSRRWCRI